MADKEIKPAFTLKYLALTIITTLLVSIVSVFVTQFSKSKSSKELHVFTLADLSLIE